MADKLDAARGLLIGAAIAPLCYWVAIVAYAWIGGRHADLSTAGRELGTVLVVGLPIACATAFIWGAPLLYALHRIGWLRASTVIATGALGGGLVAAWLAYEQRSAFVRVRLSPLGGIILGALSGAVCWWAGWASRKHS